MILQILERTPPWVFVPFIVLLVLGAVQSRPRDIGRARVYAIAVAMAMQPALKSMPVFAAANAPRTVGSSS